MDTHTHTLSKHNNDVIYLQWSLECRRLMVSFSLPLLIYMCNYRTFFQHLSHCLIFCVSAGKEENNLPL